MKTKPSPDPVTTFSFVGNLGCIRFPPAIRKASAIKRGDQLTMSVEEGGAIVLELLQVALPARGETVSVDGCACQRPPAACGGGPDVLTVGWSYVRLAEGRAVELGLLPGTPIRLVGASRRITVAVHRDPRDLEGVPRPACPP